MRPHDGLGARIKRLWPGNLTRLWRKDEAR